MARNGRDEHASTPEAVFELLDNENRVEIVRELAAYTRETPWRHPATTRGSHPGEP
jgi:hypothetical protein